MEINFNRILDPTARAGVEGARARQKPEAPQGPLFSNTAALESSLSDLPDVRPDAVQKARELLASSNYPQAETISKIATLLAMNLDNAE